MPKRLKTCVGVLLICLSLLSLYQLINLQYSAGKAYPRYSSLRTDPIGTAALYDSLNAMQGLRAVRHIDTLGQTTLDPASTLLFAAGTTGADPKSILDQLDSFVQDGGELIIFFRPIFQKPRPINRNDEEDGENQDEDEDEDEDKDEDNETPEEVSDEADTNTEEVSIDESSEDSTETDSRNEEKDDSDEDDFMDKLMPMENISERWGFSYGYKKVPAETDDISGFNAFRQDDAPEGFPQQLEWHSSLYFTKLEEHWNTLYEIEEEQSVLIERRMGAGRIVLISDNYPITNEALYSHRQSEILAWALTTSPTIVFEESHLGIVKRMGMMSLMLHYGLLPFLLVLLLMTLLFIWRNAVSLVPRHQEDRDTTVRAFTTIESMAHLARRAIPESQLMETCWNLHRSASKTLHVNQSKMEDSIQKIIHTYDTTPRHKKDAVATYNQLHTMVNERKSKA